MKKDKEALKQADNNQFASSDQVELHKNLRIGYAQAMRGEGISSDKLKRQLKIGGMSGVLLRKTKRDEEILIESAFEEFYERYGKPEFKENEWAVLNYTDEQFTLLEILIDFEKCQLNQTVA